MRLHSAILTIVACSALSPFWATLQNSDGLARDQAEALDLRDCSPVTTGY